MKTLEYLIKANSSDFVTAVTKAETIYGQALKGMADKAKQISLFKQAKDEADSTGTALVKLKTTAEQVRKALGDSGGSLQQSQQLAKAEAAISKTEAAMRGQVAAVVSMRQALAAAGVDTRNLAAEQDKMASAIARASGNVNGQRRLDGARDVLGIRSQTDIQREIQQVSAAFTRLTQNPAISMAELSRAATATKVRIAELRAELQGTMPASSFLMSGAGKLVAMASAVVSLNAALALTRSILSTAGQFETLRTQLNAVEKSATKGGDAFAYIKQQAVNTPFQVTNLTQTYIRLRNYGLDPTAGSMQAIIDQAAKLGASQEMLERITLALGQAWTKQKLQGEEIMQLNEAGVPVWDLLSKAMNKSAAELMKMSENGQLGREAITALMQAMENDAAGAAASQMQTWNGVVSNATDLWQEFLDSIGQAGLLQFAKDSINQLTAALQKMKETGELSWIAHDIADALTALGKVAIGTAKFITDHHDAILAVAAVYGALAAKKLFAGLATDLVTFGTAASKAATALKELKEAQTVGDLVNTVVGKGGVKKAAAPASTVTKVAGGVLEGASYAQGVGMAETYRLAKTVPAAASGGAAEGVKVAESAALQSGKAWAAAANVAKKAWSGVTAEVAFTSTSSLAGVSALIARFTVWGTVAYAAYKALEPIISNTIDLHKMENDALEEKRRTLEEINRLEREGAKQDSGTGTGSVTRVYTAEELASSSTAQLKSYRQNLDRAHQIQRDQANQRARDVTRAGGVSDQDAQYQQSLAESIKYAKALKDLDAYEAKRIKIASDAANTLKAVKNGELENLAADLAKEQKLYDKANEQLQAAVADRKKHQDAWANNKAVDPAAKAAEPQGVTDYYESLRKANELARKAATSQQTAGNTGLDSDFQKAARDASAAETAFSRVMEVINQLRTNGKITEGEFNFMNDQAGRAQDSADAGMEKTAKSTLQKAMEQIESIKAAVASVQKMEIPLGLDGKPAVTDLESIQNMLQQAAAKHPVQIATTLVGPAAKYLQDARKEINPADRPLSEIQSNAEGGAISGPGTGTSDSILSWLSNGEFVVKAAATSYYGPGLLHAINQMRLPRFAVGGAVGQLPAVSQAMAGIPTMQAAAATSPASQKTPLNIYLPGQAAPVPLYGDDDAVQQLVKAATLMNLKQG